MFTSSALWLSESPVNPAFYFFVWFSHGKEDLVSQDFCCTGELSTACKSLPQNPVKEIIVHDNRLQFI